MKSHSRSYLTQSDPIDSRLLPRVAQKLDHTCGAACFDSMFQLLLGQKHGEIFFALKLGALDLGYTPVESIVALAQSYGLDAVLCEGQTIEDLTNLSKDSCVLFVTWWFDDAGHYSLVREIDNVTASIVLMDPWAARENLDTVMPLTGFAPLWNKRGAKIIAVRKNLVPHR